MLIRLLLRRMFLLIRVMLLLLLVLLFLSVRCQESDRGRGARNMEPRRPHQVMCAVRGNAKQTSRRRGQNCTRTIDRAYTALAESANVGTDAETAALSEHWRRQQTVGNWKSAFKKEENGNCRQ